MNHDVNTHRVVQVNPCDPARVARRRHPGVRAGTQVPAPPGTPGPRLHAVSRSIAEE